MQGKNLRRSNWEKTHLRFCQLALSTRHKCDESLPSLLRGKCACRKAAGPGGWLNWFSGSSEAPQLLVVVEPFLGSEPPAGRQSVSTAAGLVRQLSGEKVCVYCSPCGCQTHKAGRISGKVDTVSQWVKNRSVWELRWMSVNTPGLLWTYFSVKHCWFIPTTKTISHKTTVTHWWQNHCCVTYKLLAVYKDGRRDSD